MSGRRFASMFAILLLAAAPALADEAFSGMVRVPGGTFLMGCSPGDAACYDNEQPAHRVTVNAFWMDARLATHTQYEKAMGTYFSRFADCPNCPADSVSWHDAQSYCEKAGKRLPTEAEWEFAARGGTTAARYGDLDTVAWYKNNAGGKTHPVGEKQPNAYGLYDMLGNVWEWCADWWDETYYASSPAENPTGPGAGTYRVWRGGTWETGPWIVRASYRGRGSPVGRDDLGGVRCVRDADAPPPVGLVRLPGGTFAMGCSPGDAECYDDEKPAHEVTVSPFWLDATAVTQAAFQAMMGANPSHFSGCPTCPVDSVTWDEARSYCEKSGKRLPTEAEWEFAARGGKTAARYGDLDAIAWCAENSDNKTHPVGQKKPNGYGLYDMLGNVWEWCADWYDERYYASSPAVNPKGPSSGKRRVLRGDSWRTPAAATRASDRFWDSPDVRYYSFGFRCARD